MYHYREMSYEEGERRYPAYRKLADRIGMFVMDDLLDFNPNIHFMVETDDPTAAFASTRERCDGLALKDWYNYIWVSPTLSERRFVETIAHEAKHLDLFHGPLKGLSDFAIIARKAQDEQTAEAYGRDAARRFFGAADYDVAGMAARASMEDDDEIAVSDAVEFANAVADVVDVVIGPGAKAPRMLARGAELFSWSDVLDTARELKGLFAAA